jgi:membrane protein YdbS with pleckstrin-like domain
MNQQPHNQPPAGRPVAQAPQGSMAQPGSGEVLFQGIAKHSASMAGYLKWSLSCVAAGALAIFLNSMEWGIPGWFLGILWLVGVPGLLWTYLNHITSKFKITRRRVETEKGIIAKKVDSLELWRVLDVQYEQSLIDRIFGIAKIKLIGTDQSDPVLTLHGIPEHRKLFEILRDAVQDARHTNRPMELVPGQDPHGMPHQDFMAEHHDAGQ